MRDAGSSVGSSATVTSQSAAVASVAGLSMRHNTLSIPTPNFHELRQRARHPRTELPASHPAHQEGPERPAVRPGAEGGGDRPGRGEGLPDLLQADRPRAAAARRGEQGIHLLHEEEVRGAAATLLIVFLAVPPDASAQATHTQKLLTPETALKAAQAAFKKCRDSGYQATVAVVDRMGVTQVLLRDRFAGPHTVDMAAAK